MVDDYERRHRHQSGLGHSAPYVVSGHPFVTGSATVADDVQLKIEFPAVTKSITVINRANAELYIYFTDATAHVSENAVDSAIRRMCWPAIITFHWPIKKTQLLLM